MIPASDRLIVALDTATLEEAEDFVRKLRPRIRWFKVGSQLFTAAGPEAVRMVRRHGGSIFLDLKWHDIPSTVASAVRSAARLGAAMMNVHIAAGEDVLRAAAAAGESAVTEDGGRPMLIGVTVLTSQAADVRQVVSCARQARAGGLHGVVASAREAAAIKAACGPDFVVVSPGIRSAAVLDDDDQRRTAGAGEAVRMGADYLVVGRPVTRADDPGAAAGALLTEIESAEKTNEGHRISPVVRLTP